jgi:hypothetical protein
MVIVSDGNEIAYAKTILELFKTRLDEKTVVSSLLGDMYDVELYSKSAFKHAGFSTKIGKIYVGSMDSGIKQWRGLYDKYGMHIDRYENCYRVYVDSKLACDNYKMVFNELKDLEKSFFKAESEYVMTAGLKKVEPYECKKSSLFSQRIDKEVIIRAYRCLSYHLYFEYLFANAKE